MHGEEFIADNMIKLGYAVISVDWRLADRSYFLFSDFRLYTHAAMLCLSNYVVARVIDKQH